MCSRNSPILTAMRVKSAILGRFVVIAKWDCDHTKNSTGDSHNYENSWCDHKVAWCDYGMQ